MLSCIIALLGTETRIKGIRIAYHEINIINFADDTIIFLRGLSCLTKIELNLELCEKASISKIIFQKARPYGL